MSVRFILRKTSCHTTDATIYARVTVDRKRSEFSINKSIAACNWDAKRQRAVGSKELMNRINPYLDELRYKLTECFHTLQNGRVSADAVKKLFTGEEKPQIHCWPFLPTILPIQRKYLTPGH